MNHSLLSLQLMDFESGVLRGCVEVVVEVVVEASGTHRGVLEPRTTSAAYCLLVLSARTNK